MSGWRCLQFKVTGDDTEYGTGELVEPRSENNPTGIWAPLDNLPPVRLGCDRIEEPGSGEWPAARSFIRLGQRMLSSVRLLRRTGEWQAAGIRSRTVLEFYKALLHLIQTLVDAGVDAVRLRLLPYTHLADTCTDVVCCAADVAS